MRFKKVILAALILGLLSFNASAGCGRWVIRDNTDFLKDPIMDMSDPISNTTISSGAGENATLLNSKNQGESSASNALPKLDLSGKWSIKLNGTANVSTDVILIQSAGWSDDGRDRIQGYGNIYENGNAAQLTATGSVLNNTLDMDLKLAGNGNGKSNRKYVLKMDIVDKTLTGRYEIYDSDVFAGNGSASATRTGS